MSDFIRINDFLLQTSRCVLPFFLIYPCMINNYYHFFCSHFDILFNAFWMDATESYILVISYVFTCIILFRYLQFKFISTISYGFIYSLYSSLSQRLLEICNLADIERKLDLYKAMFYHNTQSDRTSNFITSDSLKIELIAGGLNWKQQDYIMEKMEPNDWGEVQLAYIFTVIVFTTYTCIEFLEFLSLTVFATKTRFSTYLYLSTEVFQEILTFSCTGFVASQKDFNVVCRVIVFSCDNTFLTYLLRNLPFNTLSD